MKNKQKMRTIFFIIAYLLLIVPLTWLTLPLEKHLGFAGGTLRIFLLFSYLIIPLYIMDKWGKNRSGDSRSTKRLL